MGQEHRDIHIRDLVLWTENPRDRVDPNASDQTIANRAINNDDESRWKLKKFFKTMGNRYDLSELPTVVYHGSKPVVYDGNRRIIIGKIIHGCVENEDANYFRNFDYPKMIPCNVCDKQTALEHVYRKHKDDSSWKHLQRDIFNHVHMKMPKSLFLIFDETTKIISNMPKMNQRFVKEEILTRKNLQTLGFYADDGVLKSNHKNDEDAYHILGTIVSLVKNKKLDTRENRKVLMEKIYEDSLCKEILQKLRSKDNPLSLLPTQGNVGTPVERTEAPFQLTREGSAQMTKRVNAKKPELFGTIRPLRAGSVNNLYKDLRSIYKERTKYSGHFPMIIRMGLRLLVEVAAEDVSTEEGPLKISKFLDKYEKDPRITFTQDEKSTLFAQKVDKKRILSLLHIGAHGYTATNNLDQTVALSLIIGKMLELSHGK